MPDFVDTLTDRDRWDIANYVRSLHRLAPWEPGGVLIGPGYHEDLIKRGDYIVHTEMCGLCHTQVNRDLIYSGDDYYLAGGMGIPIYPHGVYVSRNLTPDIETGIGSWSVEEVANAIRNGRTPDRLLFFFGMPWMYLHNLSQEDALAVASFLKSREPVTNRIPMPLRYGFVETVVAKISYSSGFPPMGNPTKLTYKAGNYGETEPEGPVREWPQTFLIHSQLGILVLAVLAYFILGRPSGSQIGRTRGLLITASSWSCIALVSFLCWVMYQTPVLAIIPPAEISKGASGGIPAVDESKLANVEMINMAHRGRYLYTVTSCAFCHGNDGSGGLKISMQSFGSLWVRNITPHEATGIGSWQDEEIARAIRSGVSKSGNALHWQGMIWDHLSNLDEEDVRSLIVYLRNMPAIENSVPEPTAPSPDDCVEYTFFLVEDDRPGCDG